MSLNKLEEYGRGFQIKVLAALLVQVEFLQDLVEDVEESYFDGPATRWIFKKIKEYYRKYNTVPTSDYLKTELKKLTVESLQADVKTVIKQAYEASDEDLRYVQEEFTSFCRNQKMREALSNSVSFLEEGNIESICLAVEKASKVGEKKDIGHLYVKDVESRYREDTRNPIETPWPIINSKTQGGLGAGDLGLIFGNPGGGKSWCLVALGAHAVMEGKTVVHYTLELSEGYVGKRYDACFTKIPVQNLFSHRQEVENAISTLQGQLVIKEYPMKRATPMTIENHLKKLISNGIIPDLVIIDYLDLLTTREKGKEVKMEVDDIYTSVKGMAKELKLPVWTVSQVNRAGAKDDIIEGDKAAGSYDKIMTADISISLSRKKEDKVEGTGRFHFMKNRYGPDGETFQASIDTSTGAIQIVDRELSDQDLALTKIRRSKTLVPEESTTVLTALQETIEQEQ